MNVIELLKADHEVITDLLEQVRSTDESEHQPLYCRIRSAIDLNNHIEEAIFYPILLVEGDDKLIDSVLDGIEGHRQVRSIIRDLDFVAENNKKFEPRLKWLLENVEHRVEKERVMLPLIEDQLDGTMLEDLGAAMEVEKEMFLRSAASVPCR
jgi:hypothetical protein